MKKYLKFLFVAVFATMTLSLASCKDDKDEPDGGDLVGTWEVTNAFTSALTQEVFEKFEKDGTYYEIVVALDDYPWNGEIDITVGKWERNGSTIKAYDGKIYTFSKNGRLIESDKMIDTDIRIDKLTNNELSLSVMGIQMNYKKVDDSKANKYLDLLKNI